MIDEDDMAIPEAQLQTWSHQGSVTQSSRPKPVDYFETRARLRNEFVTLRIVMPIRPRRSSMTFGRSPLPALVGHYHSLCLWTPPPSFTDDRMR